MTNEVKKQVRELTRVHNGLACISCGKRETVVKGGLRFEASHEGLPTISDRFDIELTVPKKYPEVLPRARETGGAVDPDYEHINSDGTFCLATPVDARVIFSERESLLGFVDFLVVPYLYGYCYWKKHGRHPFGERPHGGEGIVQYYKEELRLDNCVAALSAVSFLLEHGYRGHLNCPCGSGFKVRDCHGRTLLKLHEHHTKDTLKYDFEEALRFCLETGEGTIPKALSKRIKRIIRKEKIRFANKVPEPFSANVRGGLSGGSQLGE